MAVATTSTIPLAASIARNRWIGEIKRLAAWATRATSGRGSGSLGTERMRALGRLAARPALVPAAHIAAPLTPGVTMATRRGQAKPDPPAAIDRFEIARD